MGLLPGLSVLTFISSYFKPPFKHIWTPGQHPTLKGVLQFSSSLNCSASFLMILSILSSMLCDSFLLQEAFFPVRWPASWPPRICHSHAHCSVRLYFLEQTPTFLTNPSLDRVQTLPPLLASRTLPFFYYHKIDFSEIVRSLGG